MEPNKILGNQHGKLIWKLWKWLARCFFPVSKSFCFVFFKGWFCRSLFWTFLFFSVSPHVNESSDVVAKQCLAGLFCILWPLMGSPSYVMHVWARQATTKKDTQQGRGREFYQRIQGDHHENGGLKIYCNRSFTVSICSIFHIDGT